MEAKSSFEMGDAALRNVLPLIFSYIPKEGNNWFNFMLVCSSWRKIGQELLPTLINHQPILWSCRNGKLECLRALLKNGQDPTMRNFQLIMEAGRKGHIDVVHELLNDQRLQPLDKQQKNFIFVSVCRSGSLKLAEQYAKMFGDEISDGKDEALIHACRTGDSEMVQFLLNQGANPGSGRNLAFSHCAYRGDIALCKSILQDERVRPDPKILFYAVKKGDVEMVRLILSRADTKKFPHKTIRKAVSRGYLEIIELLLEDGRVNPNPIILIEVATVKAMGEIWGQDSQSAKNRIDILVRLLKDVRIDAGQTWSPLFEKHIIGKPRNQLFFMAVLTIIRNKWDFYACGCVLHRKSWYRRLSTEDQLIVDEFIDASRS